MAAVLGPVVRAPWAVLVMAVEMVGAAGLLGSGIITVLVACLVVGGLTLYRSQLDTRDAHRPRVLPPGAQPRPATADLSVDTQAG